MKSKVNAKSKVTTKSNIKSKVKSRVKSNMKVKGKRILKNGTLAGYVKQTDGSWKWRFIGGAKKKIKQKGGVKIEIVTNYNNEKDEGVMLYLERDYLKDGRDYIIKINDLEKKINEYRKLEENSEKYIEIAK